MALDSQGKTVVAGDFGVWGGSTDLLKVISVMELGANSRLEICREGGNEGQRTSVQAKDFTKVEPEKQQDEAA